MFDVADWVSHFNGEDGPRGMPSYVAFQFISRSTGDFLSHWTASFLGQETISAHLEW